MAGDDLHDIIFKALDHAVKNGYRDLVMLDTLENVAIDLIDYDADLFETLPDGVTVADVMPHVEAWRLTQKPKVN